MPIHINYAAKAKSSSSPEAYLKEAVFAKNELRVENLKFSKEGFLPAKRIFQFSTAYMSASSEWGDKVLKMHDWLAEKIQGPWMLTDEWTNHGHSYGCKVHIERFDQRDVFEKSEFGQFFSRRDKQKNFYDRDNEIRDLAIIKGIVPAYNEQEDIRLWLNSRIGYNIEKVVVNEEEFIALHPEHPNVEQAVNDILVKDGLFKPDKEYDFICSQNDFIDNMHGMSEWRENVRSYKLDEDVTDPHFNVKFHYADVEEAFKLNWGSFFTYDPDTEFYKAEYAPKHPKRDIPESFIAYLNGKAPDPSPRP